MGQKSGLKCSVDLGGGKGKSSEADYSTFVVGQKLGQLMSTTKLLVSKCTMGQKLGQKTSAVVV